MVNKPNLFPVKVKGIEVIQSLQNFDNDVSLIHGKPTYVRVYLDVDGDFQHGEIRGVLDIETKYCMPKTACSLNTIKATTQPDLLDQRLHWNKSLNFHVPQPIVNNWPSDCDADKILECKEIEVDVKVKYFEIKQHATWERVDQEPSNNWTCSVKFQKDIDLYIRLVGYRYTDQQNMNIHQPTEGDYLVIREFLETAFPISNLHFSAITIDAPRQFNKLRSIAVRGNRTEERIDLVYSLLFQNLLAVRNQDITQGMDLQSAVRFLNSDNLEEPGGLRTIDERTIYLGVIRDPSQRFGGAAMKTPEYPTTHMVAFSATESEGVLTAHELGHLLGRLHPGIPNKGYHGKHIGQKDQYGEKTPRCHVCTESESIAESVTNNYSCINDHGHISNEMTNPEKILLGLDTRHSNSRPVLLHHTENFDLMTYRYPQWLSGHTYEGILCRLQEIQSHSEIQYCLNVIGEYNFVHRTGIIKYIFLSIFDTASERENIESPNKFGTDAGVSILLKVFWSNGNTTLLDIDFKDPNRTDSNPDIGVFQESIKLKDQMSIPQKIELLINCAEIDVYDLRNDITIIRELLLPNLKLARKEPVNGGKTIPDIVDNTKYKDEDIDPLYIKYSVDNGSFYFVFDWRKIKIDEAESASSIGSETSFDIAGLVGELNNLTNPVITTLQFKRTQSEKLSHDNWETVAVTSRLRETIWISPVFTARLESAGREGGSLPDLIEKNDIHAFQTSYTDLGIHFRVLFTILGVNFKVYDSKEPQDFEIKPESEVVRIEAFGSLGPKRQNFFRHINKISDKGADPNHNDCSESTHINCRKYYRPTVNIVDECELDDLIIDQG